MPQTMGVYSRPERDFDRYLAFSTRHWVAHLACTFGTLLGRANLGVWRVWWRGQSPDLYILVLVPRM